MSQSTPFTPFSRRGFLVAGCAGLGLTLPEMLRAEAATKTLAGASGSPGSQSPSSRSVINIHLDGGPPQMDMIDPKPDAPREIRGEFSPISTKIPGLQVGELLPKIASVADRFAFIRSLVGADGRHDAFQCQSGFKTKNLKSLGGRPAMGSIVSKLRGSSADPAPSFVDLMQGRPLVRNSARPGFLGPSFGPFRPDMSKHFSRPLEDGMKKELARLGHHHSTSMTLSEGLTSKRVKERAKLLAGLDRYQRELDASGQMLALDRFNEQAVSILTSGHFAEAIDLSRCSERELAHYRLPKEPRGQQLTSDTAKATLKLLLARRLVDAGVRCVSVSLSDFDTHSNNYPRMRHLLPIVDHAIWALITDLEERGTLNDVSIVIWGEFGRTPKVNSKNGGRDHWPSVGMAMLAGGGMNVGQVIGRTDRFAGEATDRPVSYQDVFATLYQTIGIDASQTTILDPSGRPQYLLEHGTPISELV
ncbi:MAG: DUF1501 domain-containing protein [Planctomycetota bacterium]